MRLVAYLLISQKGFNIFSKTLHISDFQLKYLGIENVSNLSLFSQSSHVLICIRVHMKGKNMHLFNKHSTQFVRYLAIINDHVKRKTHSNSMLNTILTNF